MEYRQLGNTDIRVSEISLGCWTLGGRNWVNGIPNGWADVDEEETIRSINLAVDDGVNHFDNADVYGNGRAERLLGRALGPRRHEVVVATKVGHFPGTAEHAYEAIHIRHQCEQSLRNLCSDTIDVYYFHHGDFGPADCYLDDAMHTVTRLREEGKIRLIGLSAYSSEDFIRLVPRIKPAVVQSWAHLMDDQFIQPEGVLAGLMRTHEISFVAFSPLNQGLLLDKYSAEHPPQFEPGDHRAGKERFSVDSLTETHARLRRVKQRFGSSTQDLARVALQYVLAHDRVACVIPGFRNTDQVVCNLAAAGRPLTPEDVLYLRGVFGSTG